MITIAGIRIGPGEPCRFVAEISNNHNGSLDRALRLVEAAQRAGADFVKFQAYTPDELIALRGDGPAPAAWGEQGYTMRTLYEKARTPLFWLSSLFEHARTFAITPFSSVFGPTSLAVLEYLHCPAYKLASLDYGKQELWQAVLGTGRPVVRSYGGDAYVVPRANVLTLYCPPGYPQQTLALSKMRMGFDGFSYHGNDSLAPVLAAAMGAQLVEIHLQLHDEPSELERDISLDEQQLAEVIRLTRANEARL